MAVDDWIRKAVDRHIGEVADGRHDLQCEWSAQFRMCHCSKRAREKRGLVKPPSDDLYFPPPDCPIDYIHSLYHDGDGWRCDECHLSWDSYGRADSAQFTDDYGDISYCAEHDRRACWLEHSPRNGESEKSKVD